MPFECPKCKSPVAREGQRFCYRCGQELNNYYDSLGLKISDIESAVGQSTANPYSNSLEKAADNPPELPSRTVVLDGGAFDTTEEKPPSVPPKASLTILLPTGDVFDREINSVETQIGKGPRNDIVIADPAVSTAHAMVRLEGSGYTINDIGSRNGTFINGERVTGPRPLSHGDMVGIGLSKLTFRLNDQSDTTAIEVADISAAARPAQPPPLTEESLASAVVAAGIASKADIDRALSEGKGYRLYRVLIDAKLANEEALRDLISRTFQIPVVDLKNTKIDQEVVATFSPKFAREHQVFAFAKENGELIIAVSDPTDASAADHVKREIGSAHSIRVATAAQIRERIDQYYGPKLIGVLPSGEKLEYPIDKQEIEIGKASHNHITLTDPTVSNTHAIVMARDGGYSIVDLGSRNGTFVNGERLGSQAHNLSHGDKVQLGQTVLTFRNPGETNANATAVLSAEALDEVRKRAGAAPPQRGKIDSAGPEKAAQAQASPESGLPKPESVQAPPSPAPESPANLVGAAVSGEPSAEDSETEKDKKKKKKKKKGGDERLRAAYISGLSRIVAQVMGVILAVLLALYVNSSMRSGSDKPVIETSSKGKAKVKLSGPGVGTAIQGGSFEASGVAFVPGSNGVLIVDDGRSGEVLWMQIDESGRQVGAVKPIQLGMSVEDPEAITFDGSFYYIVGSQSAPNAGERNALIRFAFDPSTQTVQKTEAITNLRDFLISNVPELKDADKKGSEGGLNIEGIAWDFKRGRWLLGLRSPLTRDNSALIVAIKLKNPGGSFSADNLQLAEPNAIPLKLAGLGIRDIQFDPEANAFLIISGAPEHHEKGEFTLWEWSGIADATGSESGLRREQDLDPKMKPEGITHVEIGGRKFLFVVGDASSYIKFDYAEQ